MKIHVLYSIKLSKNLAVFEIKWRNVIESNRPKMGIFGIRRMYFKCVITKAKNTHSECVKLLAFAQQLRASVICYTYIVCLFYNLLSHPVGV
jgi:hypothetical protein